MPFCLGRNNGGVLVSETTLPALTTLAYEILMEIALCNIDRKEVDLQGLDYETLH